MVGDQRNEADDERNSIDGAHGQASCWRMILSENRFPLFGIMR